MQVKKKMIVIAGISVTIVAIILLVVWIITQNLQFGFARTVSQQEEILRTEFVQKAETWLGKNKSDGSHREIIDLYNSHEPLAQNYLVSYDDKWCATFVSATAIVCDYTDIIPTECGCERQIGLFQQLNRWEEDDSYVPLPGDIIYYSSSDKGAGDCTSWSDHVGIVVGTCGPFIKVIEGNYNNRVAYRYIRINARTIRGYGLPDFETFSKNMPMD